MKRQIKIRRSFVSSAASRRSISLTTFFFLFQMVAVLVFWNRGICSPLFTRSDLAVGDSPSRVAIADLEGDGYLDLVVTNHGSYPDYVGSVSVFLGNGDGTFQSEVTYPVGNGPNSLAIVYLNGDSVLDLVEGNRFSDDLGVLLGNGDGSFADVVIHDLPGISPDSLATGDFNLDGATDLVVGSFDDVIVLLGNGDATFGVVKRYATEGHGTNSVATGDLDGDGALDVAATNGQDRSISVLLGWGDGRLMRSTHYDLRSPGYPQTIAMGDLSGDGTLDLAVTSYVSSDPGYVAVLIGDGDGSLSTPIYYDTALGPRGVAIGDLDGNQALDMAVANDGDDNVSLFMGNGDGTFQQPVNHDGGDGVSSMAFGDLNGDGALDLAATNRSADTVSVFLASLDCIDGDEDGFGLWASQGCTHPERDCDDADPALNPAATEVCDNGVDDDCDQNIDDEDSDCPCPDNDGDGFGTNLNGSCQYFPELDCDDSNGAVNPGAIEGPMGDPTCSDGLDNDCDGSFDTLYPSRDADCVRWAFGGTPAVASITAADTSSTNVFNYLTFLLLPVGAIIFLRILRRKR